MITHSVKKQPNHTVAIALTIPWADIQAAYGKSFDKLLSDFAYEGFRKGKVPRDIAEKNIPRDKVYQQVIQDLLPQAYEDVVKKESIKPIVQPRLELKKAKENEPWEVEITTAEKPSIELGDYKKYLAEAKSKEKKPEIWVPGKEGQEKQKEDVNETNSRIMNAVLTELLKRTKLEIPDIIIEDELNTRLTRLVDELQKIGLTVESYVKSKNTTVEELKKQFRQEIEETYKLEFILMEIADKENIQVDQADLERLLGAVKDEAERKAFAQNAYLYASVLRKQKTLDFLTSL